MPQNDNTQQGNRSRCDYLACPATRYFVIFMLFLGMANSYIMRTNMSVAIVAMVNHTAIANPVVESHETCKNLEDGKKMKKQDGEFVWNTKVQGHVLSSFFYGYTLTQIPIGLLTKKYGALRFLGYGMLFNSVLAFLVPIAARKLGPVGLSVVRFFQGFCEGPIVPCSHALIAKWTPPNERSRMCAAVYAGAQFGTVISYPISGILSEYGFDGGWPSVFYVFGTVSLLWSISFLIWVFEDPQSHPKITEKEKQYITKSIWGAATVMETKAIPFRKILKCVPFYAILVAHMGQNYGYESLMTELPTYLKQILHFSLKENGIYASLPFVAMWVFAITTSIFADWLIATKRFSTTATRKAMNTIGQFGPGIALIAISFVGCNRIISLVILTIGVGLNGAIFSGFKANHIDLSPQYAGFLIAITNCLANVVGVTAPIIAGHIIYNKHTVAQWRIVFFIAAGIYIGCSVFYNIFASGQKQAWDGTSTTTMNE